MRNPYERLETETFRLITARGIVWEKLKSQGVKGNVVKFFREDIDFTIGDILERDLPHGKVERWRIDEVDFKSGFHAIPAHFVLTVSNVARPREIPAPRSVTYNLYGTNSRVNNHSIDRSHNTVQIDSADLFTRVEAALTQVVSDHDQRQELQRQLAQMQARQGQPAFAQLYVDFIGLAADHLTVLTPFLPALAQLLVVAGNTH